MANKKTAESILSEEKYFSEDPINTTNSPQVNYTAKFPQGNLAKTKFSQEDFESDLPGISDKIKEYAQLTPGNDEPDKKTYGYLNIIQADSDRNKNPSKQYASEKKKT